MAEIQALFYPELMLLWHNVEFLFNFVQFASPNRKFEKKLKIRYFFIFFLDKKIPYMSNTPEHFFNTANFERLDKGNGLKILLNSFIFWIYVNKTWYKF